MAKNDIARVKQQVKGISVDALLPNPANPMLVRRIEAPRRPALREKRTEPTARRASAASSAQIAGPSRAAVSCVFVMEKKGFEIQ